MGNYDTLFLIEESEAQREAERQEALSHRVFTQGTYSSGPVYGSASRSISAEGDLEEI